MASPVTRTLRFSPAAIAEAARLIAAGEPVAMPTETVYGLAADATNGEAVARIYAAKGRPSFNPLIVHVADLAAAERIGVFDDTARALAKVYWPPSHPWRRYRILKSSKYRFWFETHISNLVGQI